MELTYPEVGATAGALPEGYRHVREEAVIGHGRQAFERAAGALMTWQVQRRAGLRIEAPLRVTLGAEVRMGWSVGPIRGMAPCRVVRVIEEDLVRGFAYGTLPGHPASGEEALLVNLGPNGVVRFHIIAFSKPARWFSKLGAPAARLLQKRITRRYVEALADP